MFPHGYCLDWSWLLLLTHVSSDATIALAYYAIPFILIGVRSHIESVLGRSVLLSFAAFIVACGTTHVMDIIVIWYPLYWLQGIVKIITAVISVAATSQLGYLVAAARR